MEININNLLQDIFKLTLEINKEDKNTIMFEFYGHCESLEIRVFEKGWSEDKEPDYSKRIFLDFTNAEQELYEVYQYLSKLN